MKARLSILSFPQRWRNNELTIRVVVMPRNFNPLIPNQFAAGTPAWVDAVMALRARLIVDGEKYPSILEADQPFVLNGIAMPANIRPIFEGMEQQIAPVGGIPP